MKESRHKPTCPSAPFLILFYACVTFRQVSGYPGGAPLMACGDMFPSGHGTLPQDSPPPFKVIVPKKKYDPNSTIKVTLLATKGYFRGLLVEARRVGCHVNSTQLIGAFTVNDFELESQHCMDQVHSAVTHKSNSKKTRKEIYWTPPVTPSGHVVIVATFVMEKEVFWVKVKSEVMVDLKAMDTPECIDTTVRPIPAFTTTATPPASGYLDTIELHPSDTSHAKPSFRSFLLLFFFRVFM